MEAEREGILLTQEKREREERERERERRKREKRKRENIESHQIGQ